MCLSFVESNEQDFRQAKTTVATEADMRLEATISNIFFNYEAHSFSIKLIPTKLIQTKKVLGEEKMLILKVVCSLIFIESCRNFPWS